MRNRQGFVIIEVIVGVVIAIASALSQIAVNTWNVAPATLKFAGDSVCSVADAVSEATTITTPDTEEGDAE